MTKLSLLGAVALTLVMLASDAMARGGSGVRGAVVGGMVGGSEGAAKGAKVGVVTGATRAAIGQETQARNQYTTTAEYQNAQHSNFNEAAPEVLGTTAAGAASKAGGEAVIRKDNKPIVGITFPADWKQKTGANYISAVSPDGQAYSMLVVDKVADKKGTRAVAEAYLKYWYTKEGQEIAARNSYRPRDSEIAKEYEKSFAKVELFTIDDVFGGWTKAQKEHFGEGGIFDQIYKN